MPKFIVDFFTSIYNILLNISYLLNSDIRRDIFIGVTGLMVAIVIFIAEVISNKKYEIEKRLILERTSIIKIIAFCVLIYFIMFLSSTVQCSLVYNDQNSFIQNDIIYIIFQTLINFFVIIFMYKTVRIFIVAVKLNIDAEYFNKELDKYIINKSTKFEQEASKKSLKNIKNIEQEFQKYIKDNSILSDNPMEVGFLEKSYIPIYSNKKGIIKKYNYKKLDSILESVKDLSTDETKEYLKEPLLVFNKKIGQKINKNDIIGYYLKGYKKYFKDFSNCVIYDENSMYIDDEIKLINENLFTIASNFNEPDDFDESDKLLNYFKYLYGNDLIGARKLALTQLEEVARDLYKDSYKNNRFVHFLNCISSLAYSNDNFEDYKQINRLIFFLYYQQLQHKDVDIKSVAYNFSVNYFKFDYFSIKKNSDLRFYDELMSNLLRFICDLIRENKFEAIPIIFKNILLEHNNKLSDDFDNKDILNLQFASGIICCILMYIEKNEVAEEQIKILKEIIEWTHKYFINTYDAWQIIINFKKYFNNQSSIQDVYDNLEFDFVDHKYLSSWSGWKIGDIIILKELLYSFKLKHFFDNNINFEEITKDDQYYYKELLKLIESSEKTKFEKLLNISINNNLSDGLKQIIADAENKDKYYVRNNKLDSKKLKEFEKKLKQRVYSIENNELEKLLKDLSKIEYIDVKLKRVCGINQLIPRDIFFKDCYGHDTIAEQYGDVFANAKERELVKKVDSISKFSNESIDDIIYNLDNPTDYLVITNYINSSKIKGYDWSTNKIIINEKSIDIIEIPKTEYIYLIKKSNLPKLQYCNFDNSYYSKNIDKNLFYELEDCSKNEKLRNEMIEKSDWLSEKGNVGEQHEYLKEYCRLRIFMAFRFTKVKNSEALKFKNFEG